MNASAPSALHPAAPLCSVCLRFVRGVHLEQTYGVSRAGSVDRDAGAVLPTASGRTC